MASAADIFSELEKKDVLAAGEEADNNPEEPMDEEEDENDDGEEGDDGDVEEDVVVQIGDTYSCKRQDGTYHDAKIMKTRMNKRMGREEFFVHYVGLNNRQNEWVDKTRLVIPKPAKEGPVANSMDLETTEQGEAPLKRKYDGDTPEAKTVKVDVEMVPSAELSMVSKHLAKELTCLLCSEPFSDPVMVECGHNFCRHCIDEAWNGLESFTCPDCQEVITEKRYSTNRALANLVKTIGATAALTPTKPAKMLKLSENCPEHDERLKLYCKDDGTLSCVICRDSLKHASHTFLPILDAVGVYRTELSAIVASLDEALKVTEQLTSQQSEEIEKHKTNVSESRPHILSEFEKLRTFVKEREEKLLEQLQAQAENLLNEMETNMVKIQESQDSIIENITMANERMNDTDSISFLTDIKSFIEKCQEQQKDVTVAGNTLLSKDLCWGTFKGPIQYSVWKQMKSFIVPLASPGEPEGLSPSSSAVELTSKQLNDLAQNSVAAATQNCHDVKTVWIVGHSLVHLAEVRAAKHRGGTQLGLPSNKCRVFWFGQKDLKWHKIHLVIEEAAEEAPAPDILVIHAGGNELTCMDFIKLVLYIKRDINKWLARWPGLKVVWSSIIQRKYWHYAGHIQMLEKARKKVNTAIEKFVLSKGGLVLRHKNINFRFNKLYSSDGEQLSDTGLDLFNNSVQDALEKCLWQMS